MGVTDREANSQRMKREEEQVTLRRIRTEELLNKKRASTKEAQSNNTFESTKSLLFSHSLDEIYSGAYDCRTRLSIDVNPPIQEIILSGIVPRFIELLDPGFYKNFTDGILAIKCRFEAAWVLTNIASGNSEQTRYVVKLGAVPLLVQMIVEDDEGLVDQGVWALGNITGDSEELRDIVLETGVLSHVSGLISKHSSAGGNVKILRNLIWLLSNLNRGRNPLPTVPNMKLSFTIAEKIVLINDPDVVSDSYWCLSYLADSSTELADAILKSSVMKRTSELMGNFVQSLQGMANDDKLTKICIVAICPIIRMLGNIVTGTEEQTSMVINQGFVQYLPSIFYRHQNKKQPRIKKEICWLLSNITAGTTQQILYILDSDLTGLLIDSISKHELFVRKEAGYAILNMLYFCVQNPQYLQKMLSLGVVQALQSFMYAVSNAPDIQAQILDCVRYALEAGERIKQKSGMNPVIQPMIDTKFVDEIEDLQDCKNGLVMQKAYNIIVSYFEGEEENL